MLVQGKSVPFSVNIACYLNDRKRRTAIRKDCLRSHRAAPNSIISTPTFSNRILWATSKREGPGLVIFDALYGPGATIDSPPITNRDCYVPTNEAPALSQVITEMKLSGYDEPKTFNTTLNTIAGFFMKKFTYSVWQGPDKLATTNETPLTRFLLRSRSGHCEYFATATVLLLRELKIPARYAVGYYVHEASHGGYLVRERDAHAWCLVWNEKQKMCAEIFDTTPASWTAMEGQRMSRLQGFWDFWSWLRFLIAKFRWGQGNVRDYILWGWIPVLTGLMAQDHFLPSQKTK